MVQLPKPLFFAARTTKADDNGWISICFWCILITCEMKNKKKVSSWSQQVVKLWFWEVYSNQKFVCLFVFFCIFIMICTDSLCYFSSSLSIPFPPSSPLSQGILWNSWWDTSSSRLGHGEWRSRAVRTSPTSVSYAVDTTAAKCCTYSVMYDILNDDDFVL